MAFTDMEEVEGENVEKPPEEDSNNRTFIIVAAVLGGITLLALLCTAAYAFLILPGTRAARQNQAATAYAQQTLVAMESTQAALAAKVTATQKPTTKPTATNTPVLNQGGGESAKTATPTIDSVAATQEALYATVSAAQTHAPTSTKLPTSGFADDVGAPALLAAAVVLVIVIFLVRRLRTS